MSDYGRECIKCDHMNDKNATYCDKCGVNMDKAICEWMGYDREKSISSEEKPKKGSYEKNFFRGKKK